MMTRFYYLGERKYMQPITVKELRQRMPAIRKQLRKGEHFLVIHKREPIATLTPVVKDTSDIEALDTDIETVSVLDLEEDVLDDEERAYYLALKPL